jgi:glutathione synthase/RimK-type ligase-like ATP-grasp enzyme
MSILFIVDREVEWPYELPGTSVARARDYITCGEYTNGCCERVVNLCRTDRYQGRGYYVSLLAEARGHRPLPDVKTLQQLQPDQPDAMLLERIEELAQDALEHEPSKLFELDAYFGREPTMRHQALARELFALLGVPLFRVCFAHHDGRWRATRLRVLALDEVPGPHGECLTRAAAEFALGSPAPRAARADWEPAVAILFNPDAPEPPSNPAALAKFADAAASLGMRTEVVDRHALERLGGFDALFIRDTTHLGHYTLQFARRAAELGLPVIDDPDSIVRCNNKVFLHELLSRHDLPTPRTVMVHRDNLGEVIPELGLPCILKQPDSEFSLGVRKILSEEQFRSTATALLERSELLVAQEWLPTSFDWRIGILDGRPLFACKYFMAPGHWQVIKRESSTRVEGRTAAVSIGEAPQAVISAAWKAANLIGKGLYGVDMKQVGERCYVIEINDNPNIDAGNEDGVLGDALYRELMGVFVRRIRERRGQAA